ncbi:hypothetical protein [Isoptericola sp. NPDC019482]|uniref:hypothetical protein n=1 Tax=Isoptericola sp. NPDC019482 TaxID=3154688 RepID=UPI00347A3389
MTTTPPDPFERPSTPPSPDPQGQPFPPDGSTAGGPPPYGTGAVVPSPPPPVVYHQQQAYPAPQPYPPYPQQPVPASSGLYVAAAAINWVVLALLTVSTFGIGIIAAAWMIPMTIMTHKGAKDRYQHTALAVCTLLFCGLISGILMLVDEGNRHPRPLP